MLKLVTAIALLMFPMTANANGWYAGIAGGNTNSDYGFTNIVGATLDETGTGVSIFIGKEVNEQIAIEGFYTDLGETTISGENGDSYRTRLLTGRFFSTGKDVFSAKTIGVSGKFRFKFGDKALAYLKGGFHSWDAKGTSIRAGGGARLNTDGTDAVWGVGTEYRIAEKTSVLLGYDDYKLDEDSVTFLHAGISFKF